MSGCGDKASDRLGELLGRVHDINERVTMTFLDVRQMEGRLARIESRVEGLDSKVDRQGKRLDTLDRKLNLIIRELGLRPE